MSDIQLFTEEQKSIITKLCDKPGNRFFINDTEGQCNDVSWNLIPKVNDCFIIATVLVYTDYNSENKINELEFKPQLVKFDTLVRMIENSKPWI